MNTRLNSSFFSQFARMGKALSSPVRLEMIYLLLQRERSVERLAEEIGISMANASQHLQRTTFHFLRRPIEFATHQHGRLDEKIALLHTHRDRFGNTVFIEAIQLRPQIGEHRLLAEQCALVDIFSCDPVKI